jgi:hypothetical protein
MVLLHTKIREEPTYYVEQQEDDKTITIYIPEKFIVGP